jgi:hypothetical protein
VLLNCEITSLCKKYFSVYEFFVAFVDTQYLLNVIIWNVKFVIQITVYFLCVISIQASFLVQQLSMKIDDDSETH